MHPLSQFSFDTKCIWQTNMRKNSVAPARSMVLVGRIEHMRRQHMLAQTIHKGRRLLVVMSVCGVLTTRDSLLLSCIFLRRSCRCDMWHVFFPSIFLLAYPLMVAVANASCFILSLQFCIGETITGMLHIQRKRGNPHKPMAIPKNGKRNLSRIEQK